MRLSSHLVSVPKRVGIPLLLLILACIEWIPNGLRWPARIVWLLLLVSLAASLARDFGRWRGQAKRIGFRAAAFGLGLLLAWPVAEAGAWLLIRVRPHLGSPRLEFTESQRKSILKALSDETSYTQLDAGLGWKQRPNRATEDGLIHSNADGFRSRREYPRDLGAARERVLTYGDSYTHGNDVADTQTWQHQAEIARPGLEMLNFGVGGYGVTQAYLRFEAEAGNYEATGAILGCMTDDLRRSVNAYYPFRFSPPSLAPSATGSPYAGLDAAGRLEFHPNPLATPADYRALLEEPASTLRELARREILLPQPGATPLLDLIRVGARTHAGRLDDAAFWLRRQASLLILNKKLERPKTGRPPSIYDPGHPVFEVNLQIFERFVETARTRNLKPLILWFPSPKDVEGFNRGRSHPVYAAYLTTLKDRGIEAIDVMEWIKADYSTPQGIDAARVFASGHYTPPVNAMIGRRLAAMDWRGDGEQ